MEAGDRRPFRCSFLFSPPLICTALSIPALILWLSAVISSFFAVPSSLSASLPWRLMLPPRFSQNGSLSRSHLTSEMNLLLSVGRVSTPNESEICSYREKVSHAPRLKKKKKKSAPGNHGNRKKKKKEKPTLSAALAGNDCWHPVGQPHNDSLFLLNKRPKKYLDWCFSQRITKKKRGGKVPFELAEVPRKTSAGHIFTSQT